MKIKRMGKYTVMLFLAFLQLRTERLYGQTKHQEATVLFYNVGLGGVSSAIGALINKPKGTRWHKALLRGLWQGGAGGLVNYSSKKMLHLVYKKQQTFYALPATVLNAAGYSIIENAALYRPFLQYWSFDYGPVRIDFSVKSAEDFKVRLLPESIYAALHVSSDGKPDIKTSLLTGTIVFRGTKTVYNAYTGVTYTGYSSGRAFLYVDGAGINKYEIIAHEMVHYYQYREYQIYNSWLQPLSRKVKSPVINKIFSRYIYMDIPYFWLPYSIEGQRPYPHYYKNFFEFEAERFTTNRQVLVE